MKTLLIVLLFLVTPILFSQESKISKSFYSSFDKTIGLQNTNLSYGVIFKENYRKLKGNHNFFFNDHFESGNITYREDSYFNVKMKYDLVDDVIILNIANKDQNISLIPEKELISKFSFYNLKFVYTKEHGFLEEKTSNKNFSIYTKHIKKAKENRDRKYIYYTFKKQYKKLLFYKDQYYFIKSKKDFITIFPKNKKTITKFYKKNKFLLKNNFDHFIVKLINELLIELKK